MPGCPRVWLCAWSASARPTRGDSGDDDGNDARQQEQDAGSRCDQRRAQQPCLRPVRVAEQLHDGFAVKGRLEQLVVGLVPLLGLQGSAQRCPIDLLQVPRVCDEQRQYGCGAEPEQRNHEQHLGSRGQVRTAARDPRDATNQPCARQNRQGPLLQGALGITLDLEQVGYPLCGRFTRDRGASPRLV